VVAIPHLFGAACDPVLWVKLVGFAFHLLSALVLFAALRDATPAGDGWALAGAVLVAVHPDLLSASVSGMEVPLAALAAVSLLYFARRDDALAHGAAAAVAFLVRPELAVVSGLAPLVLNATRRRRGVILAASAVAGTAAVFALLAARNWAVSGLPLPATFYAKVGNGPGLFEALRMGFAGVMRELPLVNSLLLVTATVGMSAVLLRDPASRALSCAAASFISGVAFCAVSFALIAAVDPAAFYHQRYVLPGLPLLIGPLPMLLAEALRRSLPVRYATAATALIVVLFLATLARNAPARFAHLANDARNIDDVQVAVGKHLATAASSDVVWAVDAGAVRYFGNAFVVDTLGLNTPELLGPGAQAFLDAHPPRWIEVVPTWSALRGEPDPPPGMLFAPSTPYTVTSFEEMATHELMSCDTAGKNRFGVRGRVFDVACGGSDRDTLAARPR
jgi:hypothetical protein